MWARIESGAVAELTDLDPAGRYHPTLVWVDCPPEAEPGWLYTEGTFLPPDDQVPGVTAADVDAERDRRIDSGVEFQGVMFQSKATDRENISGAAQLAFMAIVNGAIAGDLRWSNPGEDFLWIASDNTLVPMDAPTVVAFGRAAAEHKQMLIFAGRQLKDIVPIPSDYASDVWWS